MFFFEKKNQKTFALLRARCDWRGPQGIKVFWFFFSKKNSSFTRDAADRETP
jgi:hypothetical protein